MGAIICLGAVVRDLLFAVDRIPAEPRKVMASALRRSAGGMAATGAVAIAALGGTVEYWGRLGDDDTGRELERELASHGVKVHAQVTPGTQTPLAAVLVAGNGERLLVVYRGRFDDAADWLPLERVAAAPAVLADFRWPAGALALYAEARRHRIPSVLDADVGDPQAVARLLPVVDHAIFSEFGLAEFAGTPDVEAGLVRAAEKAARVVAVTLGERGSVFLVDGRLHAVAAAPVDALDTNGAGDVFHGAYAWALAQGHGVLEAARVATAAAALKCRNGSGWGACPDRTAVDRFLEGWST